MIINNSSLGCGKTDKLGFICGVANAWGREALCEICLTKLKTKWKMEDLRKKAIKKTCPQKTGQVEVYAYEDQQEQERRL